MSRTLATLLLFLTVGRASHDPAPASEPALERDDTSSTTIITAAVTHTAHRPKVPVRDSVFAAIWAVGLRFGVTENEARCILGEPDSVKASPLVSMHDDVQKDSIVRLYYPKVMVALYRITRSHEDLLAHVVLTDVAQGVPFGIGAGTNRARLVAILGPPAADFSDDAGFETLEYLGPNEEPNAIRFVLSNDQLQRIEWITYSD